uniref:Uncharacterized protein n=1 Tax=Saccharum hybrid cultivar R570 TaxID=131158 RepID=A0A059PZ18_9POAL|nr:hypothetical protein SHCRBa_010_J05_R_20 [Saccharum hybrid cultivar R570]
MMAGTKTLGPHPRGDDGDRPPRPPRQDKGKAVEQPRQKKQKHPDRQTQQSIEVAATTKAAKCGGNNGALRIGGSGPHSTQPLRRSPRGRTFVYPAEPQQQPEPGLGSRSHHRARDDSDVPPTEAEESRSRCRGQDDAEVPPTEEEDGLPPCHVDLRGASTSRVKRYRLASLDQWFPEQRDVRAGDSFYTTLQASFFRTFESERIALRSHRLLQLGFLRAAAGSEEIQQHIEYLPGLEALVTRPGLYVEEWVKIFYSTVWIDPDHEFIQFMFRGEVYKLLTREIRETFGFVQSETRIHSLCYGTTDPPRRSHGGVCPPATHVAALFRPPFGPESRRTPDDLTPVGRVLNAAMRRTLLPRVGFREALTNMQQWLLGALASHTVFDVADFLLCEIEDAISDGFRMRRQLPYAHYLSHMFMKMIQHPRHVSTLQASSQHFGVYRPTHTGDARRDSRVLRKVRRGLSAEEREEQEEQDEAIRQDEHEDLAHLFGEDLPSSDSSDDDFRVPSPPPPPQAHDAEAGGSGSGNAQADGSGSAADSSRDQWIREMFEHQQQAHERQLQAQAAAHEQMMALISGLSARQDQFQAQLAQERQTTQCLLQHLLGQSSLVPPVQQAPTAPLQTPVVPALQSSGLLGQGGFVQQQFVSPLSEFSCAFTTPGSGVPQGFAGLSQSAPAASAGQTKSVLASTSAATASCSLSATFNETIGLPTSSATAKAHVTASGALESASTETVPSSVASSQQ